MTKMQCYSNTLFLIFDLLCPGPDWSSTDWRWSSWAGFLWKEVLLKHETTSEMISCVETVVVAISNKRREHFYGGSCNLLSLNFGELKFTWIEHLGKYFPRFWSKTPLWFRGNVICFLFFFKLYLISIRLWFCQICPRGLYWMHFYGFFFLFMLLLLLAVNALEFFCRERRNVLVVCICTNS